MPLPGRWWAAMARKREPALTPEERERHRRMAAEASRERCARAAEAATAVAREWLQARGLLVPGEGVRDRLVRLYRYRADLQEAVQRTYRPTMRQQQARATPGLVEVEF